jgi:hypothetical protein
VGVLDLLLQVIHQKVLAEGIGCGEVSFPAADFRDFLDEVDEAVVR